MSGADVLRGHERSAPSARTRAGLYYGAGFVVAVALLLGGGTAVGLTADLLVQLASLPLLLLALTTVLEGGALRQWRWPLVLTAGALALPLIQLVPLPPLLWTAVPGRGLIVETFTAMGTPLPWLPLSLAPHATLYAFFAMFPALALFLTVLQLEPYQRLSLIAVPLAVAVVHVLASIAQAASGNVGSVFGSGNLGYAVGLFANRNHFAALLYALLPLAAAWIVGRASLKGPNPVVTAVGGGGVILLILIGLSISYSRAGVAFGTIAALGAGLIAMRWARIAWMRRWLAIALGIVLILLVLALQLKLVDLLLERGAFDQTRLDLRAVTTAALHQYYALGSGLGTFVQIYMRFENLADVDRYFANHAHNDWLELALEGGIPAILLLIGFVVWLFTRLVSIWFAGDRSTALSTILARAASISIVLLLMHSTVDYPLRTTALSALFALCAAFLCETRGEVAMAEEAARRRTRSHGDGGRRGHADAPSTARPSAAT